MDEVTADKDGFVTFPTADFLPNTNDPSESQYRYVTVAEHQGEMEITPPQSVRFNTEINKQLVTIVGDTIVDRALYNGGDVLHSTAVLRAYDWQGCDTPLPWFQPSWGHVKCHATCSTPWGQQCAVADELGVVSCVMARLFHPLSQSKPRFARYKPGICYFICVVDAYYTGWSNLNF